MKFSLMHSCSYKENEKYFVACEYKFFYIHPRAKQLGVFVAQMYCVEESRIPEIDSHQNLTLTSWTVRMIWVSTQRQHTQLWRCGVTGMGCNLC